MLEEATGGDVLEIKRVIWSLTQHLFQKVPTLCLLFSSCLLVERSDPEEDQELHWPQERSTLYQRSPDREKVYSSFSHLSSKC